jgi:hypothetical protein
MGISVVVERKRMRRGERGRRVEFLCFVTLCRIPCIFGGQEASSHHLIAGRERSSFYFPLHFQARVFPFLLFGKARGGGKVSGWPSKSHIKQGEGVFCSILWPLRIFFQLPRYHCCNGTTFFFFYKEDLIKHRSIARAHAAFP